jgi:hypothetical protein
MMTPKQLAKKIFVRVNSNGYTFNGFSSLEEAIKMQQRIEGKKVLDLLTKVVYLELLPTIIAFSKANKLELV